MVEVRPIDSLLAWTADGESDRSRWNSDAPERYELPRPDPSVPATRVG